MQISSSLCPNLTKYCNNTAGQVGPKVETVKAYLSLGSNLGPRGAMLQRAVSLLEQRDGLNVAALSSVYETKPWGVFAETLGCAAQRPFWNLCVRLELDEKLWPAHGLLRCCLHCEEQLGRKRTLAAPQVLRAPRARCIDLDLIDYNGIRLQSPALTLPHPRFLERLFVLVPLLEVAERELERAHNLRQTAERLKVHDPDWGHKIGELSDV